MKLVGGVGILLLACGGKSVSPTDAAAGASNAGATSSLGGSDNQAGSSSEAGSTGEASSAGNAEVVDENDPKGTLVIARQIDWLLDDAERLYWLADPDIFQSCSKADCANTVVDFPSNVMIPSIGNFGVFFGGAGLELVTCPKTGCVGAPANVSQIGTIQIQWPVAADGEYIYWLEDAGRRILRCLERQCEVSQHQTVASFADPIMYERLSLRGDYVYWATANAIWRAAKDGSTEPALVASIPNLDFARYEVGPERVYWVDPASQNISSCPVAGCGTSAPTVVVPTTTRKGILHADDSGLYWGDGEGRDIHYCPLDGCVASTAITEGGISGPFTLDARYVYWVPRASPIDDIVYARNIVRRLKPKLVSQR